MMAKTLMLTMAKRNGQSAGEQSQKAFIPKSEINVNDVYLL